MVMIDRYEIILRMDDEEEGDAYYEYHALTEEGKVVPGSRWTHHHKDMSHLYYAWLESHDFKVSGTCQLVGAAK